MNKRAVVAGVIQANQSEREVDDFLSELAFLAETAGFVPVKKFTQKLDYPNPRTYMGKGKLEEIRKYLTEQDVDTIIIDDELSPSQLRNMEQLLKCNILDRTNLILDIFAGRAKTAHAMVQVELAQYEYLLPRLIGMWTHLKRQRGGIGLRGPGETELETDRRVVRQKIARLKEQLKKIDRQKAIQRSNRGKMVRIALVGYTNVGKSTLMNKLSKTDVPAENRLFATLDTTVRKIVIGNLPLLISDTVGFIRKLPHHLIESFKSTLDEVRESDLLLHVVDISHPGFEEQIKVVEQTLADLGAGDKPTIMVFNKIDAYTYTQQDDDDLSPLEKENYSLEQIKNMWLSSSGNPTVFISAIKKENFEALRNLVYEMAKEIHTARYPYDDFLF